MTTRNARLEKVLALIPEMDPAGIQQLERNATARPTNPDSAAILAAITAERERRPAAPARRARTGEAPAPRRPRAKRAEAPPPTPVVPEGIGAMTLDVRIEHALRDLPPSAAELRRLLLLHDNPGLNEDELATIAGDTGPGGFNLTIGGLCRHRQAYLPEPEFVPARKAPLWSGLLCELTERQEPSGRMTHEWRLLPATVAALRRLGHLPALDAPTA
jgi:hypothetical protein